MKGPDRTFSNGVNTKITPSILLYRWHSNQFILSYLINTPLLIYFESLFLINYIDNIRFIKIDCRIMNQINFECSFFYIT
jgi:hypothetical protein